MVNGQHIIKLMLYICATVVIIFTVKSCEVTPDIMKECQTTCRDLGNRVVEVTSRKCICSGGGISTSPSQDIWVLPGK